MAGIYVHVPFCKSRCVYCGFFSTTSLSMRGEYVDRVCDELAIRQNYLNNEGVRTIYFGGGTPTLLPPDDIERILNAIYNIYKVRAREGNANPNEDKAEIVVEGNFTMDEVEIAVEGNPDDLTPALLQQLRQMGVNRLSMGVQTFSDKRLRFLHRRHTAAQAIQAVRDAQAAGFSNISIDLMFGFPGQTLDEWQGDVEQAISLGVQHISAYSLMYEDGTRLGQMLENGEVSEIDEELSLAMYQHLIDALTDAGFEHYEISNFALPHFRSRHNSSYWHGVPYLGVGAGAHSFDGRNRHYNPDSLTAYLAGTPVEEESLTDAERYNEFIFTGLRTREGVSLAELRDRFGQPFYEQAMQCAQRHTASGGIAMENGTMRLTRQGLFVSNDIMSDFMQVN